MDNYPENIAFGGKVTTFYMYCHNTECERYNKQVAREGYLEMETGWGEPYDDECMACGAVLASWEKHNE